jgi:hypothetical protein
MKVSSSLLPGQLYKIIGDLSIQFSFEEEPKLRARTQHPGELINHDHSASWLDDEAIVLLIEEDLNGQCKILYEEQYYLIAKWYLMTL